MASTKQVLLNEIEAELSARRRIWNQAAGSTSDKPVFIIENYNRRYSDLLNVKKVLEALPDYLVQQALYSSQPINFPPQTAGQAELF